MEAQRILEKHIAIFPLMKSRNHFCLIVLDIMWGHTSMTEFGVKELCSSSNNAAICSPM